MKRIYDLLKDVAVVPEGLFFTGLFGSQIIVNAVLGRSNNSKGGGES